MSSELSLSATGGGFLTTLALRRDLEAFLGLDLAAPSTISTRVKFFEMISRELHDFFDATGQEQANEAQSIMDIPVDPAINAEALAGARHADLFGMHRFSISHTA